MQIKFFHTFLITSILLTGTNISASKHTKMSEAELTHALQETSHGCTIYQHKTGHHPVAVKAPRGGRVEIIGSRCPECETWKAKIKSHHAAVAEEGRAGAASKTAAQENIELQNELLRAQIAALKK